MEKAAKHFSKLQRKWITDKRGHRRQMWVKIDKPKVGRIKKIEKKKVVKMRGGIVKIEKKTELALPRKDDKSVKTEFDSAYKITYANKTQIIEMKKEVKKNDMIYHHDDKHALTGYAFPKSEKKTLDKEVATEKLN